MAYPTFNAELSSPGAGLPFPRHSSLYNPDSLVACLTPVPPPPTHTPTSFLPFALLATAPSFSSLPLPFSNAVRSDHVHSGHSHMALSLPILSLLSTINLLLHHTEGTVISFPLFLYFILFIYLFIYLFIWFFETVFLCVALAVLELTL
jgi:hypothetical protein